jgi:N-acetylglucosaminyl-diphospho-decaprenol L-rhamnosyltransferase
MNSELSAKISILIVTFNNASTIELCLESLQRQTFTEFKILIFDNASGDSTIRKISKNSDIKMFSGEKNIGFGAAINKLAEKAEADYLFILNPDCICPPETLARLYDFARIHPGAVSPALIYPDGKPQASARSFPSYKNIIFSRRSPLFQLGLTKTGDAGYLAFDQPAKVPAISGTAMFIRSELFRQIGGFDERFFMYLEDIDFCRRLAEKEIDVWYLPDVKVSHVLGASSNSAALKASFHHHCSMYKYFTKHFPRNKIKNLLLLFLLGAGFVISVITKILGIKRRK